MSATAPAAGSQQAATGTTRSSTLDVDGGRFDFDDGGTYCGGWQEGKAHGHGVCTGPKGQGEYAGSWHYGFEVSGVYTWPSGSTYEGHWQNGKRHGLGVETRGRWVYRGEWTSGFKGRYGVRQSTVSMAKYEGTWANGLQDGYGSETYADGGNYQGQWLRGMRHGYGVRSSAPFGMASLPPHNATTEITSNSTVVPTTSVATAGTGTPGVVDSTNEAEKKAKKKKRYSLSRAAGGGGSSASLADGNKTASTTSLAGTNGAVELRGGFVLRSKSDETPQRRRSLVERSGMKSFVKGLKLKKQLSTGDLDRKGMNTLRSTGSANSSMSYDSGCTTGAASVMSEGSNQSFVMEDDEPLDPSVVETYIGEWKNDKRSGFGIGERSDGLKYEGEWYNNRKYGYGVTTFRDGTKEEGKYKNNVLITSNQKRHMFLIRSAKFRERIDSALNAANRASKIALQKADIAISRTATARGKGELADIAAIAAREDAHMAVQCAQEYQEEIEQNTPAPNPSQLRPEPFFRDKSRSPPVLQLNSIPKTPTSTMASGGAPPSSLTFQTSQDISRQQERQQSSSAQMDSLVNQPRDQVEQELPSNVISQKRSGGEMLFMNRKEQPPSPQPQYPQQQSREFKLKDPPGSLNRRRSSLQRQKKCELEPQLPRHQVQPFHEVDPSTKHASEALANTTSIIQNNNNPPSSHFSHPSAMNCDINVSSRSRTMTSKASGSRDPYGVSSSQMHRHPPHQPFTRDMGQDDHQNLSRLMDDHFEHYKRPPSRASSRAASRETSVDRIPHLFEAPSGSGRQRGSSRPGSRTGNSRPGSRPPMLQRTSRLSSQDDSRLNVTANTDTDSGVRYRGLLPAAALEPSQEIHNLGTIPKRTESLYMKYGGTENKEPDPSGSLQRKKSLPDVQNLVTITKSQGSQSMTREEISVLSSSRRDNVRRQMEEEERLKNNPIMYIFNPRIQEWISRQQLMLFVLFVNLSLAFMFFKLLT